MALGQPYQLTNANALLINPNTNSEGIIHYRNITERIGFPNLPFPLNTSIG